jgi:MinD superfamily P-loop ATPase
VVVEPTLSGIHDLKRALELLDHFNVEALVCINKHDLNEENTAAIKEFCSEEEIEMVGQIPFDPEVTKAMVAGRPVVEYAPDSPASEAIKAMWERLASILV